MRKARTGALALSIWILMVTCPPTVVQAYCPTECKRHDPKVGYCIEYGPVVAGCTESGPSGRSGPARSYGAIAYSPADGDVGYSMEYGNQGQAEARAKKECGKSDCEIAVWYRNSCGAVAKDDDGGWAGEHGDNEQRANQAALTRCASVNGKTCKVIATYCSH